MGSGGEGDGNGGGEFFSGGGEESSRGSSGGRGGCVEDADDISPATNNLLRH